MNDQEVKKNSKLKRFGGFVIAVAVVLGFKFWAQGDTSKEVHAATQSWIVEAKGYDADSEYYEKILKEAHEEAFGGSYKIGTKRKKASFDDEKYFAEVFAGMQKRAQADGRSDVAQALQETYEEFQAAQAASPQTEE